jgi:hypothetical protein
LTEVWSLHELAIKAAPLILIAVGLSVCYRSNNWNIGAEGQFIMGAIAGSILPIVFYRVAFAAGAAADDAAWALGGALFAGIPAFLKAHLNTNEILTSLMLVYIAQLFLDWLMRGPWRNPGGMNFPESGPSTQRPSCRKWDCVGTGALGFGFAIIAAILVWFMMRYTLKGFEIRRARAIGAGRAFRRLLVAQDDLVFPCCFRARWRVLPASPRSAARSAPAAGYFARLRFYCDHRRLSRTAQSARHRRSGLVLALTYLGGEAVQVSTRRFRQGRSASFRGFCCSSCSPATRSSTTKSA